MEDLKSIRNVSIIAHIDAGKTTTTERMLYYTGKTHRIGDIDDGSTVMDYLPEERERGITIVSAAASFTWKNHLVHLIDTPGHIDFTAEVERSLRVIDGAVVIFSGMEGVEAQSEKVWYQADRYKLPRLAFINKLDRTGADFDRVVAEIRATFGDKALPIILPVGREQDFHGVLDVLGNRQLTFEGESGDQVTATSVPDELKETIAQARVAMIDKLSENSDELATMFIESITITAEQLKQELKRQTQAGLVVPILCGSSKRNIGVQPLMDAIIDYLPSPGEAPPMAATRVKDGSLIQVQPDPDAPFAGLIFKVVASNTGDLYYLRTYQGTLQADDKVFVPRLNDMVRVKRLLRLYAKQIEPIEQVGPGDIVAFTGPRDVTTGDTLCLRHQSLSFESMVFPEPVLSLALEPRSSKDKDKLDEALALLVREDPTLHLSVDEATGQRLLSGMGELHLEIGVHRLHEEFNLPIRCGEQRVAYRETIDKAITTNAVFEKVMGDHEVYAGVTITLTPKKPGDPPFEVISHERTPNLARHWLQAALKALGDALRTGGLLGYPLIYVTASLDKLEVIEGKTTEGAILGAILRAVNDAIRETGTHLMEPIMALEVTVPEEYLGDVTNDVSMGGGIINDVEDVSSLKRVTCEVPLVEMFGFGKSLPKVTGGRGSFSMEPKGYSAARS